jgi:intracellular septation protein A
LWIPFDGIHLILWKESIVNTEAVMMVYPLVGQMACGGVQVLQNGIMAQFKVEKSEEVHTKLQLAWLMYWQICMHDANC